MAENRTCQYKGRTYRLLYRGKTKYSADKAKLAFMDGSKEFWVDGSAITEGAAPTTRAARDEAEEFANQDNQRWERRGGCAECGRGGRLVEDLEDGLMKHYRCCDIPPSGGY